ncbi:tubulin beta chain-like [Leptopilina heterotoma]|uniref:tubulin beta chain-like n=1 Tax=Leptopilina heterotoma TaxID=63436 RepID=UPI001CA8D866|nr:tubulin beta chain-like [Leptopilina heterotoma]
MREMIHVQIGQCGNSIGSKFWEVLTDEHGINADGNYIGTSDVQLKYINVFFKQGMGGRYVPRSLNVDLDPGSLEMVKSGPNGRIFSPDSFISSSNGAANNFAKGYFTEGAELANETLDIIRLEAENCDLIQGFQVIHSLGGGTGSGMGTRLMTHLKEDYSDRIVKSYSVIPSPKVSNTIVEPYNAILTLSLLTEITDETFCIDNDALYHILTKNMEIVSPTYPDMNHLISNCIAGITASLRFPGQLNMDLRKLLVNMVPFPKLHFFVPGFVPLMTRNAGSYRMETASELTRQIFEANNMLAFCDPQKGRFITVGIIFRGNLSSKEIEEEICKIRFKTSSCFMNWLPNSVKVAMCDIPPRGLNSSATAIINSTAIQEVFRRVDNSFTRMFQKRAYLHWYLGEGIHEDDFIEAQNKIQELIFEYQQHQEGGTNFGDLDEDDEEESNQNDNENDEDDNDDDEHE